MKNVLISKVTTVFWRAKLHKTVRECLDTFLLGKPFGLKTRENIKLHSTQFDTSNVHELKPTVRALLTFF